MTTLVIGGAGFLGRRLVPLLVSCGERVVCMDVVPSSAFDKLGDSVQMVRGDVSRFEDVALALHAAGRPRRVINLAYTMGGDKPPHAAFRLNVAGMENCFEASRLAGVRRVVFASSLAVSGAQHFFGFAHPVTEDDPRHGTNQYATHKIFNENQARDFRNQYGMEIVAIRPANVTGADKQIGSMDHVLCITEPARGRAVSLPYRDAMRCPIHVDEVAEIFARVTLADRVEHSVYNTGGDALSLGEIAAMVRELLPEAQIDFERERGGRELAFAPMMDCWLIDSSRLREEFGIARRPFRERLRQIVDEVRLTPVDVPTSAVQPTQ